MPWPGMNVRHVDALISRLTQHWDLELFLSSYTRGALYNELGRVIEM
jgi:hypothetical protein